jgi:hypothetical protein
MASHLTLSLSASAFLLASFGISGVIVAAERDDGTPAAVASAKAGRVANIQRFVVPYFKSNTTSGFRTAAVVTAVNNGGASCETRVAWFFGGGGLACQNTLIIGAGQSLDFCTRVIPSGVTTCNATCNPQLTFNEGKAVVFTAADAACSRVRIDPRTYYLTGTTTDTGVAAVSNTNVVQ